MPAKGKHRRPRSLSITRGLAYAGTGGAALALPLTGASGAHAAGAPAPASAPVAAHAPGAVLGAVPGRAVEVPVAPAAAAPTVYTVVPGDHLSKIAAERGQTGGWQRLYADNREAVGADPSLIHPGLRLTLGGKAKPVAPVPAPASAPVPVPVPAPAAPAESPEPGSGSASGTGAAAGHGARPGSGSGSAVRPSTKPPVADEDTSTGGTAGESGPATGPGASTGSGFVAPVGGRVSTPYRAGGAAWSSGYHTGVDFTASSGTTVKAVGAGTVVSAGWGGAYGNEVVVRHADGRYSQYAHLSVLSVSTGQSVTTGQRIGLSGSTGNSTGPHLHFEIRTGPSYGSDIDPLGYLRSKGANI
ncbi:peptidoglycan DD-metalloendopeptidase family protein [Streptomyces sp. NPDC051567]|uniref:M23 family metallopeptidase n=1 Tax=Streptomyces sp. NPDC051567 TaxID=3365660 RepID=UPI0037B69BE2